MNAVKTINEQPHAFIGWTDSNCDAYERHKVLCRVGGDRVPPINCVELPHPFYGDAVICKWQPIPNPGVYELWDSPEFNGNGSPVTVLEII